MSQSLVKKLDQFTRKYYTNKLIRGAILCTAVIIAFFLVINVLEYHLYLSKGLRKVFFFGFVLSTLSLLGYYVVYPITQIAKLGKVMSYEQAAVIIGEHFGEVKDKLLNLLQLQAGSSGAHSNDLILASIEQKTQELRPVPFTSAINFGENRRYLRFLIPPLVIFLGIMFINSKIITEGSNRLWHNDVFFEKDMPFQFLIQNDELKAVQNEDFPLTLQVEGASLPNEVHIHYDGYAYKLFESEDNVYLYDFINLQKDVSFYFSGGGFRSKDYTLQVLQKPVVTGFEVTIDYPDYTGRLDETLKDQGDLAVPQGSILSWDFSTKNTSGLVISFPDTTVDVQRRTENSYQYRRQLFNSVNYAIGVSNEHMESDEEVNYLVSVTPDHYPQITVEEHQDSTNPKYLYYLGEVSDDYGLKHLSFNYQIEYADSNGEKSDLKRQSIALGSQTKISRFSHYWDLRSIGLRPGDHLIYYFEVWDNDGVNGSKSTRSTVMTYAMPSIDELEEQTENSNSELKDKMDEAMNDAAELAEDMQELKDDLAEKKGLDWEDKKKAEALLDRQKELKKAIEEIQQDYQNNIEQQQEYKQVNENIAKKQEQLKDMFDKLLSDEMKDMMKQMEEMLDKMNKQDMMNEMEDFKFNDEQLEKELDRMMELFKQLEMEQKVNETVDKMNELAEEQKKLAEESLDKKKDAEALEKKQEKINQKLDKIKEDIEDIQKMNEELGTEMDMEETLEKMEETQQQLEDVQEQLGDNKKKKASEGQKDAGEKMEEMAQQMQNMMQSAQMEQAEEDLEALRQLLENLIILSFDQEQLIDEFKETNINNPKYVELVQEQFKIKDDAKMVEDSLYALAKRVFQIESFVTKEINDINKNLAKGIDNLEERKTGPAGANQQYVMTGFNNLALMLSEVMQQMQQQMADQMKGSQQCQKPKGSKSCNSLSKMQKQLNDQMKQMSEMMKNGQKPNGREFSKQMAEMAAKQQAIRESLKQIEEEEGGKKPGEEGSLGDLKEIMENMEKTEEDLVNKQLTTEMIERQQEIMVRLLEAADAEKKREMDKKRESTTAQEISNEIPPSLEEYLKKREAEVELYKTVPPALRPYYRSLVEEYFKSITF